MAGYMSIMQTALMNGLDPEEYLRWHLSDLRKRPVNDDLQRNMLPFSSVIAERMREGMKCSTREPADRKNPATE